MVGHLLLRGMLVGVVAGLLAFGFAKVFGEPQVDRAIAFEAQQAHAGQEHADHQHGDHADHPHDHHADNADAEPVSRTTQAAGCSPAS
jgi:ABC-type nickel/cobalt efflux system permease component RcnA